MTPAITRVLRSRWFAGCVHACLWLLLYLAVLRLAGKAFDYREADSAGPPPRDPVPVAGLGRLFAPDIWPKTLGGTNMLNPFFTRHFIPQQAPPPTTRTIEVTYQGFYQAGDGPKHVIFRLSDAFTDAPIGAKVAPTLFVADANMQALTLTNTSAQTNIVPLNVKKEIVVPIQ
jgi:hypothetical protein